MPKITIRFAHSKKSKLRHTAVSTYFFGKGASTGPVVERGKSTWIELKAQDGDVVEFATTPFQDEFDVKIFRKGKILNGPTEDQLRAAKKRLANHRKKFAKMGKKVGWVPIAMRRKP